MSSEIFRVIVPENVHSGNTFQVLIGSDLVTLSCPINAKSGSKLSIKVLHGSDTYQMYPQMIQPPRPFIRRHDRPFPSTKIWVIFDVILFILFILACTIPAFAIQRISDSCLVTNPYNNQRVHTLYYVLYKGLGHTSTCSSNDNDLCLEWGDKDVWKEFSHLLSDPNASSAKAMQNDWLTAQILIPLCALFAFLAAILHYLVEQNQEKDTKAIEQKVNYTSMGGNFIMIACIMALIATNMIAFSTTTSSKLWTDYYSAGHNLINLVEGTDTNGPIPTACSVSVFYVDAGILLSIATPIAFATSFSVLISTCCYLRALRYNVVMSSEYMPSSMRYRNYPFTPVEITSPPVSTSSLSLVTSPPTHHVVYVDQYQQPLPITQQPSAPAVASGVYLGKQEESKDNVVTTGVMQYTVAEAQYPTPP